jgi:hypothetical protein
MSMGMSSSASFNGMGIGEMRMPVDVNRLSKALTIVTSPSIKSGMGMIVPDSPGGKKVNRGARLCEAATITEGGHGNGHGQPF